MSESHLAKKGRIALVASVAANIFLIAFLAGQTTSPCPFLPPEAMGRPGMGHHGGGFFGPHDFLGAKGGDSQRMGKEFEQMDSLRKDFAAQLKAGPVNKDQALEHFRQVDQVMDAVRSDARQRVAEKISTMSEQERANLAQRLLDRRHGMHGPQAGAEMPPPPEAQEPAPEGAAPNP